ncbi:Cytochrome c-type biogenesis protein Ccs1/ResB [Olavius algarvensis associated proteobacterium Delta 3]|nr:Cytochrome c-type biogenesis protein Ccs1/ResB [Olavius algarvensis associated proteobacterium Delta 3]
MDPENVSADYLNNIWKFFASLQLTIVVLLSLAITSIIGTLIPQNEDPGVYFQAFGPFLYRLFDVLDIFDMYHSWWFQMLILLLTANVLVCSIDRLSLTWKIIFPGNPRFTPARFRSRKNRHEFKAPVVPDRLSGTYRAFLSKRFHHTDITPTDTGVALFAEKWRWARLGVYVVHLSVILLLMGGLVGSMFGFDGFVNIPEGESVDTVRLRNSSETKKLDFAIRCDDFDLSFYNTGQPKEFRSSLTIVENGKSVLQKDIIVNDPLRYRGINIFQASYGEMAPPQSRQRIPVPETITLSLTSTESGMTYQETLVSGQTITIPEGGGTFTWTSFSRAAEFRGQPIGPAIIGKLTPRNGDPTEIVLPLQFPSFDRMRRGEFALAVIDRQPDTPLQPDPVEKRYYTGLQVTRDPGVWIVYTGFILMIAGCFVTFFMSHQQVYVELSESRSGSRVMVTGIAYRNKVSMANRVEAIARQLEDVRG